MRVHLTVAEWQQVVSRAIASPNIQAVRMAYLIVSALKFRAESMNLRACDLPQNMRLMIEFAAHSYHGASFLEQKAPASYGQ